MNSLINHKRFLEKSVPIFATKCYKSTQLETEILKIGVFHGWLIQLIKFGKLS